MPDFGTARRVQPARLVRQNAGVVAALLLVFTLLLADFFDTMGTMTAIGAEAGLLDEDGNPPNTQRILIVDSLAAAAGGAAGVSQQHVVHRVAPPVSARAPAPAWPRVVTGVLFLLATFFAPLVAVVPYEAAVPALVLVGFLMMQQVKGIDWDDLEIAIPAFLTIVLMPFTYSISAGIGAGFVAYVLLKVVRGKAAEVHPLMWVVAGAVRPLLRDRPAHRLAQLSRVDEGPQPVSAPRDR